LLFSDADGSAARRALNHEATSSGASKRRKPVACSSFVCVCVGIQKQDG
jgi:hypothetical protein